MPKPGEEVEDLEVDTEGADGQTVTLEDDAAPAAGTNADGSRNVDPDEVDPAAGKLDNKAFAAMRKANADMKKQLEEAAKWKEENERLKAERQANPAPVVPQQHPLAGQAQRRMYNGIPVPQTKEEWNALAAKDWQTAVDMKAIIKAEEISERQNSVREQSRVMEDSKQFALKKHPELNDINTPKSQVFLQILRENPDYLQHPKGPIIAMREMEARLEEMGMGATTQARAAGAQAEAARQSRTALSTSGGRIDPSPAPRTVTLTKQELEFCEHNGLKPEIYAKRKLERESAKKGAL